MFLVKIFSTKGTPPSPSDVFKSKIAKVEVNGGFYRGFMEFDHVTNRYSYSDRYIKMIPYFSNIHFLLLPVWYGEEAWGIVNSLTKGSFIIFVSLLCISKLLFSWWLKGLYHDFHRKIKKVYWPKLRSYNNYSHQIAFEMDRKKGEEFVCKHKPRNRMIYGIKNRTKNRMKWNNHTKCFK
jgi:hypothetical protein